MRMVVSVWHTVCDSGDRAGVVLCFRTEGESGLRMRFGAPLCVCVAWRDLFGNVVSMNDMPRTGEYQATI